MKTKTLMDAINSLTPGTTSKGMLDGGDTIVIYKGELTTYNDRISISVYLNDPGLDIKCAVNAIKFKNVIKGIKEEDIDLSFSDNILSIVSEKTEAEIPVSGDIKNILNMITTLSTNELEFTDLPDNFNTGLNLTRFNISDDYSDEKNLFCLYLNDGILYSADNHRCTRFILNKSTGIKCLIPKNNLADLATFQPIGITISKGWIHFLNAEDTVFSCRTGPNPENYPVTENLFKSDDDMKVLTFPDELKEILEDISILFDEKMDAHKGVRLEIKDNTMFCEIEREDVWVKKKINLSGENQNVYFVISSVFLLEVLGLTNKIQIAEKKIIFETEEFKHILLLQI